MFSVADLIGLNIFDNSAAPTHFKIIIRQKKICACPVMTTKLNIERVWRIKVF